MYVRVSVVVILIFDHHHHHHHRLKKSEHAIIELNQAKDNEAYYKTRVHELELQLVEVDRQRFGLASIEGVMTYDTTAIVAKPKAWRASNQEKRAKQGVVYS